MDIGLKREFRSDFYTQELYNQRSPNFRRSQNGSHSEIKMSCISSNFSSFFLDSLNDPSEFAKYLGNSENKTHTFDDQIYGTPVVTANGNGYGSIGGGGMDSDMASFATGYGTNHHHNHPQHHHHHQDPHNVNSVQQTSTYYQQAQQPQHHHPHHHQQQQQQSQQHHQQPQTPHPSHHHQAAPPPQTPTSQPYAHPGASADVTTANHNHTPSQQQQQQSQQEASFDNSFTFSRYLGNSEYGTPAANGGDRAAAAAAANHKQLMDLDNTPPSGVSGQAASTSNSVDMDTFDHDSKSLYDIHNSNESGMSDQRTSSNASECSDNSNQANGTKPLTKFFINENFEVHGPHKVEEGIFQHMNKLPVKKKDTLKGYGVTFTGSMSVAEKLIIVDNFAKFCEEYGVTDHRPFLQLNQSGMQKPEQIKFARYLGQGLPRFTLFCIYSNFKNMFCIKRFENYGKNYNLHYILDKTRKFLTTSACGKYRSEGDTSNSQDKTEIKSDNEMLIEKTPSSSPGQTTNGNDPIKSPLLTKSLASLTILENFHVHETHRIEDGIFTHIGRLSSKKQEMLKECGIQSNHSITYAEKVTVIENFMKFCREYNITDHRPFLDFHLSGLSKTEQIKFARYLGQGLPNLTLYKIYSAFKDILALNRIEKLIVDGYDLDMVLKKKKKNIVNRMNASKRLNKDTTEANSNKQTPPAQDPNQIQPQPPQPSTLQQQPHLPPPQIQVPVQPMQQMQFNQTPYENMVSS